MTADQSTAPLETPMPEQASAKPRELTYADSADDLRRELVRQADTSWRIRAEINAKANPTRADKDLLLTNILIGTYAYNLAGLIGWIGREFGEDAKWRAAMVMDNSLMNGDDGDIPLNADIAEPGQVDPEPGDVWKVSDETVPIGGVSPESFVIHSDWNGGHPVAIVEIEDGRRAYGVTFAAWRDVRKPEGRSTIVRVPSDMQVTPCTLNGTTGEEQ